MHTTLKSSALELKERGVFVKLLTVCLKELESTLDSDWVCLGVREISDVEPTRTSQGEEIASKASEGNGFGKHHPSWTRLPSHIPVHARTTPWVL